MREVVPISVVIPAFNAARFIESALESVARQTVLPLEIIVVDDGSEDETASIAATHRVRILSVPHGGLAVARNRGIDAASCEWVALLDADDRWHPRKLELQWDLAERAPDLDLVATDFDEVALDGRVLVDDAVTRLRQYEGIVSARCGAAGVRCDSDALAAAVARWDFFLPSALLVRRSVARRLRFDPGIRAEDWEFVLRLIARHRVGIVELPLVAYLRHGAQITATWRRERAAIELCEHVTAHPGRYHPESVRAFRAWEPAGRLRLAFGSLRRGEMRAALRALLAWLCSSQSWTSIPELAIRLLARRPRLRRLLTGVPAIRTAFECIPGREIARARRPEIPLEIPWRTRLHASRP
jgi:hypothetical protein